MHIEIIILKDICRFYKKVKPIDDAVAQLVGKLKSKTLGRQISRTPTNIAT